MSGSCHTHQLQSFTGVSSGSFPAPDHEYPSHLEIELTARDVDGPLGHRHCAGSIPRRSRSRCASSPAGMNITLGGETAAAPFTRQVIKGSTNAVGTETPQTLGGLTLLVRRPGATPAGATTRRS